MFPPDAKEGRTVVLEESEDPKQVFVDAMNDLWDISIARIMNITDSLEMLFKAVEADEKKIVGDQLSQIIGNCLEAHVSQKSYWALRERLLNFDESKEKETT